LKLDDDVKLERNDDKISTTQQNVGLTPGPVVRARTSESKVPPRDRRELQKGEKKKE